MYKLRFLLLSLLLVMGLAFAQDTATPAPQELPPAMVRVIHLSPNAPSIDISLTSTGEDGSSLSPEELAGLSYEDQTDYLEVPAGNYNVMVSSDGATVLEQEVNLNGAVSYTVAALGLVLPEEGAEAPEEGGGFFDFIQNLFGGDDDRDALALRLEVLEDDLYRSMEEGGTLVRVVHASPGTDAVDFTVGGQAEADTGSAAETGGEMAETGGSEMAAETGGTAETGGEVLEETGGGVEVETGGEMETGGEVDIGDPVDAVETTPEVEGGETGGAEEQGPEAIVENLAFGEVSNYNTLESGYTNPAIRIAGSGVEALNLSDSELTTGNINTVFVIGTSLEQAPLTTIVLSDAPQSVPEATETGAGTVPAAGSATGGPETGGMMETGGETGGN